MCHNLLIDYLILFPSFPFIFIILEYVNNVEIESNIRKLFFLFTFGELILEVKINTKILIEAYLLNYKKKLC